MTRVPAVERDWMEWCAHCRPSDALRIWGRDAVGYWFVAAASRVYEEAKAGPAWRAGCAVLEAIRLECESSRPRDGRARKLAERAGKAFWRAQEIAERERLLRAWARGVEPVQGRGASAQVVRARAGILVEVARSDGVRTEMALQPEAAQRLAWRLTRAVAWKPGRPGRQPIGDPAPRVGRRKR
jgi:hypothetical protein